MGAFTFLGFFVVIPAYHFGVVERFGKRTGRILYEGFRLKIPLIDGVELISLELDTIPIAVEFTTIDKLKLTCSGSLQWRPDPDIKDDKKRNTFVTMSEDIITTGMADAIKAKLGALGGKKTGKDFIQNRQAIGDIINCALRLSKDKIPHQNHDSGNCGVDSCRREKEVDAKNLIDFYNKHWRIIKPILGNEDKEINDHSPTEERYGIDIKHFALANIAFSEETAKAFEKEKQAEARARAFDTKLVMVRKAKELGASPQEAFNAADVSLDPAVKKEIVSVEGEAGVLGGLLGKFKKGDK